MEWEFAEFGDNGLLACTKVVGVNSRKWGDIWRPSMGGPVRLNAAGIGSKNAVRD